MAKAGAVRIWAFFFSIKFLYGTFQALTKRSSPTQTFADLGIARRVTILSLRKKVAGALEDMLSQSIANVESIFGLSLSPRLRGIKARIYLFLDLSIVLIENRVRARTHTCYFRLQPRVVDLPRFHSTNHSFTSNHNPLSHPGFHVT